MRLGIVGAGMIVGELMSISSNLKDTTFVAICGTKRREEAMRVFQEKYRVEHILFDYDELLKMEIDTVYIGLPNQLHFEYAKKALEANKHVIVEKPFTDSYEDAVLLNNLAREKKLFLFEAITTLYFPNYYKIKEQISKLGNIKIVQCNFSQYSSRYDKFKEGIIAPAFDPRCSGGALMDLNVYNIHYVVGLFGRPKNVEYYPNVERDIDTSGMLILNYDKFQCICIAAKDCQAPSINLIQGDKGYLWLNTPTNTCEQFILNLNDGITLTFSENKKSHRMIDEFLVFEDQIRKKEYETCYKMLEHSLLVMEVLEKARENIS
ncbi:MAG: Gfo/Idh/MocA family protein [Lachnospiraceae bacterium]